MQVPVADVLTDCATHIVLLPMEAYPQVLEGNSEEVLLVTA